MNTSFISNLMLSSLVAVILLSTTTLHLNAASKKHGTDHLDSDQAGNARGKKRAKLDPNKDAKASAAAAPDPDVDPNTNLKLSKQEKNSGTTAAASSTSARAAAADMPKADTVSLYQLREKRDAINREMEQIAGRKFLGRYRNRKETAPYKGLLAWKRKISELQEQKKSESDIVIELSKEAAKNDTNAIAELNTLGSNTTPPLNNAQELIAKILVQELINNLHDYCHSTLRRSSDRVRAMIKQEFFEQRVSTGVIFKDLAHSEKASEAFDQASSAYARYLVSFEYYKQPDKLRAVLKAKALPGSVLNRIHIAYALFTNGQDYLDPARKDLVTISEIYQDGLCNATVRKFEKSGYKHWEITNMPLLNNLLELEAINHADTIETIRINQCGLETLHANIFGDEKNPLFPNLKQLHLEDNKITVLKQNCFAGLPDKCSVFLEGNPCLQKTDPTTMAQMAFAGAKSTKNGQLNFTDVKYPAKTECPICHEELEKNKDRTWVIPSPCGHVLCWPCDQKAKALKATCSMCRQPIAHRIEVIKSK